MPDEEVVIEESTFEVLNLPFKVTALDQDGLIAIVKNFQAIEDMLQAVQIYMNQIGFAAIIDSNNLFNNLIGIGLDADLPKVRETYGRRLYWAYDTKKLYLLKLKEDS